ncbi:hypothetical protein [Geothrix fuzhouensis]|uniref:hypothetical protein n=1 Tax=Geothrix fuzhouensis TaxID=2966451 RepID=UPI0021491742|nr:hypothetical protein [Geothrix fuzhouensis]
MMLVLQGRSMGRWRFYACPDLALGCVLTLAAQDNPLPKPTARHLAMQDQAGT